jgi:hypothetical protein
VRLLLDEMYPSALADDLRKALSSRLSRRPVGRPRLVRAIQRLRRETLDDRVVYLEDPKHV